MKEDIGLAGTDKGLKNERDYRINKLNDDSTFNEHPVE